MECAASVSGVVRWVVIAGVCAPFAAAQCPQWSDGFVAPGTDAGVFASAVYDDGSGGGPALYVAGDFSAIGALPANRIARGNGTSWSALGAGAGSDVVLEIRSLIVHDDGTSGGPALYAGGVFDFAGVTHGVARWDGSSWTTLGSGVDDRVNAFAIYDDGSGPALYAAGFFTHAGGAPADKLARWDGANWSQVGGGVPGAFTAVHALAVHDDGSGLALFAGGEFAAVGSTSASNIAKWNGSSWSALASGTDGAVRALAVYEDGTGPALYAGGEFANAGGAAANRIASWDGSAWLPLGSGVDDTVRSLGVYDDGGGDALFVGGHFSAAGGAAASRIARWNGAIWSGLGTGIPGWGTVVWSLGVFDAGAGERLIVGGQFAFAGTTGASNLAAWDGANWSALATGHAVYGDGWIGVAALHVYDDGAGGGAALYAGGDFDAAGTLLAPGIARWNGQTWLPVGAPTLGVSSALSFCEYDDGTGPALFAGSYDRVFKWNGTTWDTTNVPPIHGANGSVGAMAVYDDGTGPALYVGGNFTDGCYAGAVGILRWDGASCSNVGGGLGGGMWPPNVGDLLVFDDGSGPALFAGGSFVSAGGQAASGIAKWNGTSWSAVGSGVQGSVSALAVFDDGGGPALYAGGDFSAAGGIRAHGVAKWDGQTWSTLGPVSGSIGARVHDLAVFDDGSGLPPALVAVGIFDELGGVSAQNIARWDGTRWSAIGEGIVADGYYDLPGPLAVYDDGNGPALFAGGNFEIAGGRPSHWIARVAEACDCQGRNYCVAKVNTLGCTPSMTATGTCELGSPQPFTLGAVDVLNQKSGVLFYGKAGPKSAPFKGGTMCVQAPLRRTPLQSSGGNPPPGDCSGVFAFDFKSHAQSGVDPQLVPGIKVNAQYWYRDPTASFGSGLTDAVAFLVCP